MKTSTQRLIIFQAGIIKLCSKEIENEKIDNINNSGNGNNDIYTRLDKIENYLRSGSIPRNTTNNIKTIAKSTKTQTTSAIAGIGKNSKPAQYWSKIINNFKTNGKIMLYTNLLNTTAI